MRLFFSGQKRILYFVFFCIMAATISIGTKSTSTANAAGKYTCSVAKSTDRELVVKITGKRKSNSSLEGYVNKLHSHSVFLVRKNKGKKEIAKSLSPQAYSYDGKRWYKKTKFKIKGKESVYLCFRGKDISIYGYQNAQMIMAYMRYNLCPWSVSETAMPYLRFNLTSGEALTGKFTKWDSGKSKWITKWDGNLFTFDIPTVKYDGRFASSKLSGLDLTPKSITVRGAAWADRSDRKPTGVEVYRAKIKANGKRGKFKRIGSCQKLLQDKADESQWNFAYKDTKVKAGEAYVYKCREFIKKENVKKFQEKSSNTEKGVAANAVGKYACHVVKNTQDKLVIKITGTDKNNGPLYHLENSFYSDTLVFKNEGEKEHVCHDLKLQAYSYNGRKWYNRRNFRITGTQSVYLRFISMSRQNINVSGYQYAQIMAEYMKYNLRPCNAQHMPQMRLNLTTGKALVADHFTYYRHGYGHNGWVTEWDGGIFDFAIERWGDSDTF